MNIETVIELLKNKQAELYEKGHHPDTRSIDSIGCGYAAAILTDVIKELLVIEHNNTSCDCDVPWKISITGEHEYCPICQKTKDR